MRKLLTVLALTISMQVFAHNAANRHEYPLTSKFINPSKTEVIDMLCTPNDNKPDKIKCIFTAGSISQDDASLKHFQKALVNNIEFNQFLIETKDRCVKISKNKIEHLGANPHPTNSQQRSISRPDFQLVLKLCHDGISKEKMTAYLNDSIAIEQSKCIISATTFFKTFEYDRISAKWIQLSKPNIFGCDEVTVSSLEKYKGSNGLGYWKYTNSTMYPSHGTGKKWVEGYCTGKNKSKYEEHLSEWDDDITGIVPINCRSITLTKLHF